MSVLLHEATVAKKPKKSSPPTTLPETPIPAARDRIDLRADPAWVARVERQAERLGLGVSAYIRQATTLKLEADEATDPGG